MIRARVLITFERCKHKHTPVKHWHAIVGPCLQCSTCGRMLQWLPVTKENADELL